MNNQTLRNHQCAICGKWYKSNPQLAGIACAVFHSPGSCCHYSEIEVVTLPMPDKTPETCQKCGHYKQGTHHTYPDGTLRCDYVDADSRCDCATPPTEPQEVEALEEIQDHLAAIVLEIRRSETDQEGRYWANGHVAIADIVAIIAREKATSYQEGKRDANL